MHRRDFLCLSAASVFVPSARSQSFDVASVKPSEQSVGPDYNNRLTWSPTGLTARNATLRRLIAEAWRLQMNQVQGPDWLDRNEYDLTARAAAGVPKDKLSLMLRALLADRFQLKQHRQTKEMRAYELIVDKGGAKIHAVSETEPPKAAGGFHFHGDIRQFADLLAVQLAIPAPSDPTQPVRASGPPLPVLDKTGLSGVYDFSVEMHPELGTDMFTQWQRALPEQLGLRVVSRKGDVEVLVVDSAAKIPTAN
jgi:uncharacterized protein (TIGR03435 family)